MTSIESVNGFLEAIAALKDRITPYMGGYYQLWYFRKNNSIYESLEDFVKEYELEYERNDRDIKVIINRIKNLQFEEIFDWKENFSKLIEEWTCDEDLDKVFKKRYGTSISDILINQYLLKLFGDNTINLLKIKGDTYGMHWASQINDDYIFETNEHLYLLHFGMSS